MANKKESVCYETDASRLIGKLEKVAVPRTVAEVQNVVRVTNMDILPRGSGTGIVGGAVPDNSLVIDLSRLNKVTNFSPSKKTVHAEAGITLKELNEKLAAFGLEFPIDPANKGVSTIGGMIATNSSGDRSMRYGTIRDWIEEIEYINGRGELMKTSKADITDICGMEGITGIIIGATIKLSPIIKRSASAYQTNNVDELLSVARRLKSEKEVVILELFSPIVSRFLGLTEKYNLIIEFNSERGKIKGKDYEEIKKIRENIHFSLYKEGYYNKEDPKLFFDKLKEFIMFLDDNKIPYIGYLGANIIIPFFKDNEKNIREATIELIKKIKGTPGKFGIGISKKSFIEPFQSKIIQRVKIRHDPFLKLNKGKLIDMTDAYTPKRYRDKKADELKQEVLSGEDLTAKEIEEEMTEAEKTPEEKMSDLIEDAKKNQENFVKSKNSQESSLKIHSKNDKKMNYSKFSEEKSQKENIIEDETKINNQLTDSEVKEKLIQYEETFKSELTEDKKHAVEEIAKNIPREIIKKEIIAGTILKTEKEQIDYRHIQDLMTGKSTGFSDARKPEVKKEEMTKGKVTISDNLDRKSKSNIDKELIDRIMGDKYKGDNNNGS